MVTEGWIVAVVAAILAVLLEVVPGLRARWEGLSWEGKRFAWLVGCVVIGTVPFGLGCVAERLGLAVGSATFVGTCAVDTLARGMQIGFVAYFASQAVHGTAHGVQKLVGKEGNGG